MFFMALIPFNGSAQKNSQVNEIMLSLADDFNKFAFNVPYLDGANWDGHNLMIYINNHLAKDLSSDAVKSNEFKTLLIENFFPAENNSEKAGLNQVLELIYQMGAEVKFRVSTGADKIDIVITPDDFK